MGRNAARELTRIVETLSAYLEKAERDPDLPLTYEGIQERTGVSRGHLSRRQDPEILEIVARIGEVRASRNRLSPRGAGDPGSGMAGSLASEAGYAHLADEPLQVVIRRGLSEIARVQQMWLGRHGREACAADAPLALYDADQLLNRLRGAVERLRPAVSEWNRRRGILLEDRGGRKATGAEQVELL